MKLRNKKTGKIINAFFVLHEDNNPKQLSFGTIEKIVDNYEDYKPKEPLIKDEKVRKAVRAWAEAIGEKDNLVVSKNMEYHDCCIYDGRLGTSALIDLGIDLDIDENSYNITELCGE